MPRESKKSKTARAIEVCRRMGELYPDAAPALNFYDPFTLVIAVLLSAQTTDNAVNRVTAELFDRWPSAEAMASASVADVADVIHSLGFYRTKSQHCVECAQHIMSDFNGEVPSTMEELTSLPGVGRKTANIVLNHAFGIVDGIAVDTHVYRIATRLGFTKAPTPAQAEHDLLAIIPQELWGRVNQEWILFGRQVCTARAPKCETCPLADLCPSAGKATTAKTAKKATYKATKKAPAKAKTIVKTAAKAGL